MLVEIKERRQDAKKREQLDVLLCGSHIVLSERGWTRDKKGMWWWEWCQIIGQYMKH